MSRDTTRTTIEPPDDRPVESETLLQGPPPFIPDPPDDEDGDWHDEDGDRHDDGQDESPLSNARVGMLLFLAAETMFFAALIGAFLVYRLANPTWPPPALPRLPVLVTGVNTLILLYSAVTMWQAQRLIRTGVQQQGVRLLLFTWILGVTFLLIQGYEWVRLVRFGLTMASGVYGATFYTLIGCHGLHVFGAVIWLLVVLLRSLTGCYSITRSVGFVLHGMYWYYVVGLWPVLYALVYF